MCLKSVEFKVDDIEIKLSGAISDTGHSFELDYIVENLFTLQEERRNSKVIPLESVMTPGEMEQTVVNAIQNRKIIIMAQDVYSDENIAFKECFVKLKSDTEKPIYPKTFTKIINRLGLTIEFDLMLLEEILLQTKRSEKNTIFALNISPTSLRNEKFLSKTKELLDSTNIQVMFVLSESEYFTHTSKYNSIIQRVKQSGALIAISRLGSIHTSFLYLRELEIDMVCFDTYYSNEDKLEKNRAIVEGFALMAREKHLKSWIKNIQSSKALSLAKELKIDYIQGKELSDLEKLYES